VINNKGGFVIDNLINAKYTHTKAIGIIISYIFY